MGYIMTDLQKDIQKGIRAFLKNEVTPYLSDYDWRGEFPTALHKKGFAVGLNSFEIPKQYGGAGMDYMTDAILYEELGYCDASYALTMCTTSLALKPVLIGGSDAQKALFAKLILESGYASFGLTEPNAGSDAGAVATTAVRDGDEYVLNGTKCFITNGGYSGVFVIAARTNLDKPKKELSMFIVERDREGLSIGKHEDKMGIRMSNTVEVILDNVRIPAGHLLGREGDGFKFAMKTLDISRPFVGAIAVGMAQRALDEALAYSKERLTFGRPICKQQAVQFLLADMEMKIQAARQMCVHAVRLMEAGAPFTKEAAIAKCLCTDTLVSVAADAIQVMGGYGYMKEYPVERIYRDAKIFQIFEGTNQIQRTVIASQLLK